jgi:hypothetical protein
MSYVAQIVYNWPSLLTAIITNLMLERSSLRVIGPQSVTRHARTHTHASTSTQPNPYTGMPMIS